jgi:hypothetical protein
MSRLLVIAFLTIAGCNGGGESPARGDRFVKFTSHLGNSFVAPSQWTSEDEGDTFSLKSPDGHAVIHAIVYTSEGSGSLDECCQTMVAGLLPEAASGWKDSEWTEITLGGMRGSKRVLIPVPEAETEWRLFVVDGGKYYHAIILNASNAAMSLNGEFYESVVCTFEGLKD